jgi:D-galactonate transporter
MSELSQQNSNSIDQQSADLIYKKITLRLIPFLVFLFLLAWIDRVNVGFAKLTMLSDLQFSEAVYGLGAGIFFLGYFLFEIPSNLLLEKVGARVTLARITFLWGITSISMAFVKTEEMFYLLRFLLGMFEAGFFPGIVLYLTYWFPAKRRAKINGLFMTSFAIAGVVGGPLAGLIMNNMGGIAGYKDWQWLFIIEGIPSVIAAFFVLKFLPATPKQASFLTVFEKNYVTQVLKTEETRVHKETSFKKILKNKKVWLLTLIYFCIVSGNATIAFWTPSVVQSLGIENKLHIGLISAIPFILGTIAMIWNGWHSDQKGERGLHCGYASLIAGFGLILTGYFSGNFYFAMLGLSVAAIGILAAFPVFWSIPTMFLTGTAAAGGIAMINSFGNLAGFVAPYMIGYIKTVSGSLAGGLYFVACLQFLAFVLLMSQKKKISNTSQIL